MNLGFKRWWAKLTGGKLVMLIDYDGDRTIRIARQSGGIWLCDRQQFMIRIVELLADGTVAGYSYVKSWKEL